MPVTGAMVELLLGSTWTDITDRVYHRDRIKISRGRQDEGSAVQPSSCSLTLNNKDGRFSWRNAVGPYYGQIGRNTPLRVSVVAGSPFLYNDGQTFNRVSTPATTALKITGDLDARWDVEAPAANSNLGVVELGGQFGTAGSKAWHAYIFNGSLSMVWTTDGTTEVTASASLSGAAHPRRFCVRITMDTNNGAGGRGLVFYTGPTLAGPWTQIAAKTVTGTAATFSSTAPLEIGDNAQVDNAHVPGRIYAAQIRSGIGGTVVASPDFTAQTPGALSFTDSAGVPWTASSSATITNRRPRFVGEVSEWPSRWDPSGADVYVPVKAAGIMRRLQQGVSPLDSTLRRRVAADASVVAYWPMEDGQGATQAYSPLPGVQPMTITGADMASDDSLAGSLPLPVWPQGSHFTGTVPAYAASSSWQVQHVYRIATAPASYTNLLIIQGTGTIRRWELAQQLGAARVRGYDASGALIVDQSVSVGSNIVGPWVRQQFTLTQSGSTVSWHVAWLVVGVNGGSFNGSYTGTVGQVTDVHQTYIAAFDSLALGHVAVFSNANDGAFDFADTGFDGETADVRMLRLAGEEGVRLHAPYGPAGTELMGPQEPAAFLTLMQEAATADIGILYESRNAVALAARPRVSLYNQTAALALDYSKRGEVAPPLEPSDDDQAITNDVTRSRPSGSAARLTLDSGALSTQAPPLGVGRYQDSQAVNVHSDDQLPHQAGWWLHLGTWDEARYPQVTVNLAAGPWLAQAAAEVDLGDLLTIDNPPPWLPPDLIRLIAQGYTELIGWAEWEITYNCTPGGPWVVGVLDDPVLGRLDTAGCTLAAAVTASATVLSLATSTGPLWTTDPTQFPVDLRLGGEVVTARAPGAALDLIDGTFESGVSGWSTNGGTLAPSTAQAHTGTQSGLITVTGTPTQVTARPNGSNNVPVSVGTQYRYTVWVKAPVALPSVLAAIDWFTSAGGYITTSVGTTTAVPAGVWTPLTVTAAAPSTAAKCSPGPTITGSPVAGTQLYIDDVTTVATSSYAASPQAMTVLRGVNGVTKPQAAGTDVRLANPLVLAL